MTDSQLALFQHDDTAVAGATEGASHGQRRARGARQQRETSMFDIAGGLAWPCTGCGAPVDNPGRCAACDQQAQAAERRRLTNLWRAETVWRFEVGEDVYAEAAAESGAVDWVADADTRATAIAQRWDMPSYRLWLPEAWAARARMYERQWTRGRLYVDAPDGRRAPLGWCWGGMPDEVPVVDTGEDFEFAPGIDWHQEDGWVDDTGEMIGIRRFRYVRPVVDVDVGKRL